MNYEPQASILISKKHSFWSNSLVKIKNDLYQ